MLTWIWLPYLINVIILVPVCYEMAFGQGVVRIFEGKVKDSDGLRWLVTSLWSAILMASVAGLFFPNFFLPLLFIQIFYKGLWLIAYAFPRQREGGEAAFPAGISRTFVMICATYPVFITLHVFSKGLIHA